MRNQLSIYRGGGALTPREARGVGRELDAIATHTDLAIATIDAGAEVHSARIHAIGYVGKCALREAALVSETEQQLAALVPTAAARLQGIADMTALALVEAVEKARR